jgi:hypothetical protein
MMHMTHMDDRTTQPLAGITVRLGRDVRHRVQHIAAAEHRSIAGYLQMLIERDLQARDEAERIIHVFTAPELQDEPPGILLREPDETEDRHASRARTLRTLLGGH